MSEASDSGAVLARFPADRGAYIRAHVLLAILGSVVGAAALFLAGNADVWVAPVAAVAAMAVRGTYLASEELERCWTLTPDRLVSSDGRSVALAQVEAVRRLGSAVQVVTRGGDKHLVKHQAAPEAVRARIKDAVRSAGR